ncbi:hypothetical protein TWF694_011273 [Orbilia ellipsospora]|uniref:Kelch repeat protein n=1 Tax=Orbilia ellipsospora TaxID=2528407 RepID=A0AAV9X9Q9_9PEZI
MLDSNTWILALLLGNKLFITGGYLVQTPNRTVSVGPWFRIVDLSTSFPLDNLKNATYILPPSVYPPTVPIVQNGVFWFDSSTSSIFYSQGTPTVEGGIFVNSDQYTQPVNGKSWSAPYNPQNSSLGLWSQIDTPFNGQTGSAVSRRTFYDDVARKGYIYGGWITTGGNTVFTDEMLTYDAGGLTWKNGTIPYGRMDGQGAGVPFRTLDGRIVTIIFGGLLNGTPLAMTTVFVHDITNNKWYRQDTNGGNPGSRGTFCTTMISAPDNSSHQILMYSGTPYSGNAEYTDVWALSLPSFTWSQVQAYSPILFPGPGPRLHASCNIINNHILSVFGGRNFDGGDSKNCDTNGNALFLYDLNNFEWLEEYNSTDKDPYKVPQVVYSAIGGNSSGYATMIAPPNGFGDPSLATIFSLATSTSPPSSGSGSGSGSGSHPNAGAIAGGTIGGLVALVGLVLAFVFFRRRKTEPVPMPPPGDDPRENTTNGAFEIGTNNQGPHLIGDSAVPTRAGVYEVGGGGVIYEAGIREAKPPPMELPAEDVGLTDGRERKPLLPQWQ